MIGGRGVTRTAATKKLSRARLQAPDKPVGKVVATGPQGILLKMSWGNARFGVNAALQLQEMRKAQPW